MSAHAAPWVGSAELSASPYSEAAGEEDQLFRAFALGAHGAWWFDRFGLGLGLELNLFRQDDLAGGYDRRASVLLGGEGEVRMAQDALRTRVGGGATWLLRGADTDDLGGVGFFLDLRPVGVRWTFEGFALIFDPLSLLVMVPDPGGIPLVDVQYRINLAWEVGR